MSLISRSVFSNKNCVTGLHCLKYQQLWIFGGETGNNADQRHLNDGWYVNLPREPCCTKSGTCGSPLQVSHKCAVIIDVVTDCKFSSRQQDKFPTPPHVFQTSDRDSGCLPARLAWVKAFESAEWEPRSGHTIVVEPPNPKNTNLQRLFLVGGQNQDNVFDDVWSWGDDHPSSDNGDFR